MKTIRRILLVDDSEATIFFNKIILSKTGYADEILVAKNGLEALEIIKSGIIPEIIFLDINMPVMNGWKFLSEFQKLENVFRKTNIFLMLGSVLAAEDRAIADAIPEIKGFKGKMLSRVVMDTIMMEYFNEELTLI
ncbi:response regulator [Aquimarina sp. BL5]|uniref:response regulator n=1 Tax=Aquimarina sp. BL5 TaxID=1714860 RepID=UPI000E540EBE|nr:response regulator [Aquimarina sp. BL5]AXT50430.1 response regulator [Aquimarina sp. BL5]RKN03094.1 response regulator [Aquimarina sp. BL5]